jgi:hypothetical protein
MWDGSLQGFGGGKMRESDHLENLDIDERKYYSESSRNRLEVMKLIANDSYWAFVEAVMNVWVP